MNIGRILPILLLLVLVPAYLAILSELSVVNKNLPKGDEVNAVLPSPILKITSLEYDGIAADIQYLKALVFYGSTITGEGHRKVKGWEYTWISNTLKASTDLDPYFLDPYFLANSILTWDAHRVREANILMEKGIRYRDWDYWLPFFVGFNYYYFLGDNGKASEFLMIASKKPGADPFFGFFAARLAYQGNRTENAIMFLEGMLKSTKDKSLRKDNEVRLVALRKILYLEKAVTEYKEKNGRYPENLNCLLDQRIIDKIPKDPYGGKFYINGEGAVKTTSDLHYMN
ncbi:MAG: hypothetical protein VB050_17765 [Geobacteraceae bacterium]|nr:hypothetical protein [Geobacteraceae bacterium]